MYKDEKIDYTAHLEGKPVETNPVRLAAMKDAVVKALKTAGVHGHIGCVYYADGRVKVTVNGEFYRVFDFNRGEFFSGYVGDEKGRVD